MAELYLIEGPNDRRYIGVTTRDARRRFWTNWSDAKRGRCGANSPLYNAMRKYGKNAFVYRTLVVGTWRYISEIEDAAIAAFGTMTPNGYNARHGGTGGKMSAEAIAKITASSRQRAQDPRERERLRAEIKKAWSTPEFRSMMSMRHRAGPEGRARRPQVHGYNRSGRRIQRTDAQTATRQVERSDMENSHAVRQARSEIQERARTSFACD